MSEEQESDMGKQAWQSQAIDAPPISLEFIHFHLSKLNSCWRREMLLIYASVGAGICAGIFGFMTRAASPEMAYVTKIGMVLAMLACVYVAIRARGQSAQVPQEETVKRSLDAYRLELTRRRDYYLHAWRWSLLPIMPAVAVLTIGKAIFDPRPQNLTHGSSMIAFVLIACAVAMWDQRRKARMFQQELDALATLDRP